MSIVNALPNGANTTFAKLIWQSFGFTPLETLLKGSTPYYCVSICWFLTVGALTYKWPGLRCKSPHRFRAPYSNRPIELTRISRIGYVFPHPSFHRNAIVVPVAYGFNEMDQMGYVYPSGLRNAPWRE